MSAASLEQEYLSGNPTLPSASFAFPGNLHTKGLGGRGVRLFQEPRALQKEAGGMVTALLPVRETH